MYDPSVGRWLQEDPIRFAAGDTDLSRYVFNAATNSTDPRGLELLATSYAGAVAMKAWLAGVPGPGDDNLSKAWTDYPNPRIETTIHQLRGGRYLILPTNFRAVESAIEQREKEYQGHIRSGDVGRDCDVLAVLGALKSTTYHEAVYWYKQDGGPIRDSTGQEWNFNWRGNNVWLSDDEKREINRLTDHPYYAVDGDSGSSGVPTQFPLNTGGGELTWDEWASAFNHGIDYGAAILGNEFSFGFGFKQEASEAKQELDHTTGLLVSGSGKTARIALSLAVPGGKSVEGLGMSADYAFNKEEALVGPDGQPVPPPAGNENDGWIFALEKGLRLGLQLIGGGINFALDPGPLDDVVQALGIGAEAARFLPAAKQALEAIEKGDDKAAINAGVNALSAGLGLINPCQIQSATAEVIFRGLHGIEAARRGVALWQAVKEKKWHDAAFLLQQFYHNLQLFLGPCFAAGTPLLTPDGSKPIEEFRVGDVVLSRDEHDPEGSVLARAVEQVFVRTGRILHLHVDDQVIRTTAEHPFWVVGKGWLRADKMQAGDDLVSHLGQRIRIEEVYDTAEYEVVYNLRVAEFHTYFVGCAAWGFSIWAHNSYDRNDAQGRKTFRNDEERLLEGELRLAKALGIEPVKATDPGFAQYAREAQGGKLLWVRRLDGEVVFVPERVTVDGLSYRLNHTAASGGANVLGAGEAFTYVARNGRVTIRELNNGSGHYSPSGDVVAPAAEVIRQQGIGLLREVEIPGS